MCNQRYEDRHNKLWGYMKYGEDEDYSPNIISYFVKRHPNQIEVTGKVMSLPEVRFNNRYELKNLITLMKSKLYTKQGKLRKKYVDIPSHEQYIVGALMNYCNELYREGEKFAYLSWQEKKWLEEK